MQTGIFAYTFLLREIIVDIVASHRTAMPARTCLENLQLLVGDRMQLEISGDNTRSQYFTTLIGYIKAMSVLVRTPSLEGVPLPIREGESVLVRGFSGCSAFVFETRIAHTCITPMPYLHLVYPESVHVTPIRDALRVRAELQGTAQNLNRDRGRVPIACTVTDISVRGAQLESRQSLGVSGDRLQVFFRFVLEPTDYEVKLSPEASIQTSRSIADEQADNGTHTYGVRFENLHTTESLLVQSYVQQLALTDRTKLV
ncbi:MAG: flagellar brake protein [Burkholderiales bacterium]